MKIEKKTSNFAPSPSATTTSNGKSPLFWTTLLLLALLAVIFWRCFLPNTVIFSNDGPYGGLVAEQNRMPSIMSGLWVNLNWFGSQSLSPSPSVSTLMRLVTTPLLYSKFLCPVALFIGGIGACFCFRQLRLAPVACILGSLAAALNSDFFSTSCWGVSTQIIGFGFMYIAIGLIANPSVKRQWIRVILAGFAVGVGVMEAYDIGAIFSLFVAAFVIYHALFLTESPAPVALKAGRGILRTALVAGFAAFIATHTLMSLVGTQIKGISGMEQDAQTKAARWEEATAFSVPKAQTMQVFIPGIFGFRDNWYMYEDDSPKEDQFWSSNPAHPIGTGYYAGVPVVLIGLWAVMQSLRKKQSVFTLLQRRAIWFWTVTAGIGLLLAYGRFAPFYQFFYAIPYSSTIRNPQKFMHVFSWAWIIVFAYGVHGLAAGYMKEPLAATREMPVRFKEWFAKAPAFDRGWLIGCGALIVLSIVGWWIYSSDLTKLIAFLPTTGIDPDMAPKVARFSIAAVGFFVLFLVLTVALLTLIFSGRFNGPRAKLAGVLLGALMFFDLGRAAAPWLVYWDLDTKYAVNPVLQFLADKPYEHRVTALPLQTGSPQMAMLLGGDAHSYGGVYVNDWKQHLFPYLNIQCTDIIQEPRIAHDKELYLKALGPNMLRFWELSNTRYLLGPNLNLIPPGSLSPQLQSFLQGFHVVKPFNFEPKPGTPGTSPADYSAQPATNGELAVLEYTDALPRAKLYANWQVNTNDDSTLQALANPAFNPHSTVLVAANLPAPASPGADPGTVEINPNYKSKRVELQADVKAPSSVLLFSERYDPNWKVEVDGKPAPELRCNYIERGVYLTQGKHDIVMRFEPPMHTLWISLAAIVMGLGLWGYLIFVPTEEECVPQNSTAEVKENSAAKS